MTKPKRLTPLYRRFGEMVANGMKPTHAMRKLQPSLARPDVKASKLMALPQVKEYIAQLEQDALATAGITRTKIVRELGRIAFGDIRKAIGDDGAMKPLSEIDDDTAAMIAGVDVEELFEGRAEGREHVGRVRKLKVWNKREALSELAAIAGMKRAEQQAQAPIGPGLTVVVQQAVQVGGASNEGPQQTRVIVDLPKPETA